MLNSHRYQKFPSCLYLSSASRTGHTKGSKLGQGQEATTSQGHSPEDRSIRRSRRRKSRGVCSVCWQQIYLILCVSASSGPQTRIFGWAGGCGSCERMKGKTVANGAVRPSPLPPLPQLWLWNTTLRESIVLPAKGTRDQSSGLPSLKEKSGCVRI